MQKKKKKNCVEYTYWPTKSQGGKLNTLYSHSSENNVPPSTSEQVQVCMAAQSNYIECLSIYLRFWQGWLCVLKDTAKTQVLWTR